MTTACDISVLSVLKTNGFDLGTTTRFASLTRRAAPGRRQQQSGTSGNVPSGSGSLHRRPRRCGWHPQWIHATRVRRSATPTVTRFRSTRFVTMVV